MMNVDRYRHADRTYVNIFAAFYQFFNGSPGAHAPGYIYAAASRLTPHNCQRMSLETEHATSVHSSETP